MATTMRAASAFPQRPRAHQRAGFTTIELLVAVTVGALLLGLTIPSMSAMLQTQKTVSLVNVFVASLHLARSEAIKRNGRTVVCKSADGLQCTTAGGWDQGWIVFHDTNNNAQYDADEWVAQQQGPAGTGLRLRGNTPVAHYVSYTAHGRARLTSGAFQVGTFTLCPTAGAAGANVRKIILGGPGRPRIDKGVAADCV